MKNEVSPKKLKLISQYDSKRGNMKLTSTSFFERLQTKTAEEVRVALKSPASSLRKNCESFAERLNF